MKYTLTVGIDTVTYNTTPKKPPPPYPPEQNIDELKTNPPLPGYGDNINTGIPEKTLEEIIVILMEAYLEEAFDGAIEDSEEPITGIITCEDTKSSWEVSGTGKIDVYIERTFTVEPTSVEFEVLQDNFDLAGEHPDQIQLDEIIGEQDNG